MSAEKNIRREEDLGLPNAECAPNNAFPDGGRKAWLTLLGALLIQFTTFGYTNAFGVYQGPSAIGWIGGVQLFLIFTCGILTGRAFDRGYFHHLIIGGSFLQSFSYFMLSISRPGKYYQVFLAQGVGSGLATGIVHIPSLSIASHYFLRHRSLAMGIVSIGGALGAVIHPIMLNRLFYGSLGFRNGVRISAAMNTALLIIANIITKSRLRPSKTGPVIPLREFLRDPAYILTIMGTVLFICSLYFPFFYFQLDATSRGLNQQLIFYYLSILNAASILGRIMATVFVPRIGVFNLLVTFVLAMTALIYSFGAVKTTAGFLVSSILYGFFSGGGTALGPPTLASLAKDISEIGARIGVAFAFSGIGGLVSTPIAGALLTNHFHWWRAVIFEGTVMALSAGIFFLVRIIVSKRKGTPFV